MRVGILGSGLMGGKLGTLFARAGHEVVFSYARSEQKLKRLAQDAEGKAWPGTPREAARDADAVLLAAHWSRMDDVLKQTGDLSGKVIVTCSLPMNDDNTGSSGLGNRTIWVKRGVQKWISKKVAHSPPAKDRTSILPARYALTHFSRHPIRRAF